MIVLKDIQVSYPGTTILEGVHLRIDPRERLALIGANGSGKSTLLRILAGEVEPTVGSVSRTADLVLGYLPQSGLAYRGGVVWEEMLAAVPAWMAARRERRELRDRIASLPADHPEHDRLMEQYGEMESRYQHEEGYAQESRLRSILFGLGFRTDDLYRAVDEFSAGWQMRLGLAKLLAAGPDFMLLDEPTDHLDLDAKAWLEGYLKESRAGFILVSHDRHLIDQLVERVVEVRDGTAEVFEGNYSSYLEEKDKRAEERRQAQALQQREIKRIEEFVARNRARKDRAKQVQTRLRQLERLERVEAVAREHSLRFSFPAPSRAPRILLEADGLEKRYPGRILFHDLNVRVERGERVAVIGPNGTGKSTLLRILAGRERFEAGERMLDERVSVGWFSQDAGEDFVNEGSPIEAVLAVAPFLTQEKARGLLARFHFRGDDVFKPMEALSGGERVRLALARLLLYRHHLLLLDEPTNHLDIVGRQALLEALRSYEGTLIFVSHDRYFIQEIATRVLEIRDGRVVSFLGSYEDYLRVHREGARRAEVVSGSAPETGREAETPPEEDKQERIRRREEEKARQRQEQRRRRRIEALEKEVEAMEGHLQGIEAEMARPEVAKDYPRLEKLHAEASSVRAALDARYQEWEALLEDPEL